MKRILFAICLVLCLVALQPAPDVCAAPDAPDECGPAPDTRVVYPGDLSFSPAPD